jgi:hypothetical protein
MAPKFLPLCILLSFLVSCTCKENTVPDAGSTIDAGPLVIREVEPNEGAEKAVQIKQNSLIEASLAADPKTLDADWYQIRSVFPQTADVRVSCPSGADIQIDIIDEAGNARATINSAGVSEAERILNLDVSGSVFFRVVPVKKGVGGAYQVEVTLKPRTSGFEMEPNDRRIEASQVALGQAVSGFIGHANDIDWYRYELPSDESAAAEIGDSGAPSDQSTDSGSSFEGSDAGTMDAGPTESKRVALRIDISALDGVSTEVQLRTEAEAILFQGKSTAGAPLSLRNIGVRTSDRIVYLVVKSSPISIGKESKKGFNTDRSYTLTVASEEEQGSSELEPNDDIAKANEIPAMSYRDGYLAQKTDVDYYFIEPKSDAVIEATLSGVDRVDVALSLVKTATDGGSDEVLMRANEGGAKEGEILKAAACDQKCYLKVESVPKKVDGKWTKTDENADQSYRLAVTLAPRDETGETEPNGTVAKASPIKFGTPIRGTIFPRKDVDYFVIDLKNKEVKTALDFVALGILKVDIGMYLHRVESDNTLTLVQSADSAKNDKPEKMKYSAEPGLYVVEIRDTKNRESNFQDSYQLTIDEASE